MATPAPTPNEAYAAAEAFCNSGGIDTTTGEGNIARLAFAAGWMTGAIRGSEAATEMLVEQIKQVFGND